VLKSCRRSSDVAQMVHYHIWGWIPLPVQYHILCTGWNNSRNMEKMMRSSTLIKLLMQMCQNHASGRRTGHRWYTIIFRHWFRCRSSTIFVVRTEITVETCKKWPIHWHSLNCSRKCVKIMPAVIGPGTDGTLPYSGIDSVAGPVPYCAYGLK